MISLEKYIKSTNNESFKIKTYSSLEAINQVNKVINYHSSLTLAEDSAIILSIFGLLQSIFVGIDALYNLTLEITNNKSNININQNETLNKLKFIRNDIVGHPINRKYGNDSVGYSILKTTNLDYNYFEYDTYLKRDKTIKKINQKVDLREVKEQYLLEKDIIINQLTLFINKKQVKTNISAYIDELILNPSVLIIEEIKEEFYLSYGKITNNRFIWRLDLIALIISNDYLNRNLGDLINFLLAIQINKVIDINNSFEKINQQKIKEVVPKSLKIVFKYLKNNLELDNYLKYLHDENSTYFLNDLNYLLSTVKNPELLHLLNVLKNTNLRNIRYLIGSTLKLYKKY